MSVRTATHAGSWYSANPSALLYQLTGWLKAAKQDPIPNSRIIVCPHAGYTYCGATMAHSYASLDMGDGPLRVVMLGPSHHVYFKDKVLLSAFKQLETPLGPLDVDTQTVNRLTKDYPHLFDLLPPEGDEAEHSLEMQMPMLRTTLQLRGFCKPDGSSPPVTVVPMMVAPRFDEWDLRDVGEVLALLCTEPIHTVFIVSSDFCHWGSRFDYTAYVPDNASLKEVLQGSKRIENLRKEPEPAGQPISESISMLDHAAMDAVTQGVKDAYEDQDNDALAQWERYIDRTHNTVCGRDPLGAALAILPCLDAAKFAVHWLDYSQSSAVKSVRESSVSYAAGCITIEQ